ncbi:TolC family protein [Snuella sp. CAU 1569]|uniref:TolC family protein n=2 Tax=Snuella sedimenti TaxID=2798802 RepID=A0A8J7LNY5_9FLAO|nr:TolC family protein [Snuella sedimenti]
MVLFFEFVFSFEGQAQKLWTLDECIAYGLEHSLEQEITGQDAAISKEHWKQSKRNLLPVVGVSYPGYNVSFGRTLDPVTNTYVERRFVSGIRGGLSSSITLFEGFRKWHQLAYQRLQYENSKYLAQQAKYDLAFKIMDLFSNVLFLEGALEIVKEQQRSNLLHYQTVNKKVALGLMAKADLYEMEATVSGDSLSVLQAENRLDMAKLGLLQEMNLQETTIAITVGLTTNELPETDVKEVFNSALETLPQLKLSALSVASAKKDLAISKSAFYPRIGLSAAINTSFSDNIKDASGTTVPFSEQIKNNQNKFVGFSFSFPIFGNGRVWSQTKVSKIRLNKAKVKFKLEQQRAYKQIQEMLQKNKALNAEELLNQKQLRAKEQAYKVAQKRFEKELINLYDLQIASNSYLNAKIEQLRILVEKSIQKHYLDFYKGKFKLPTMASN